MPAVITRRTTAQLVTRPVVPLLHLLPRERSEQYIVAVTFRADDRRWHAVGGGETVAAAVEWARESCPDDGVWEVDAWRDVYGE